MTDQFDPDTLRKEFADYCDEVAPGIKAKAPLLNQMETLALIAMTMFQAAKELKAEKADQVALITALESENRELSEFVIAVGGFWGNSKSKLVGELSLAEVINRAFSECADSAMAKDAERYRWLRNPENVEAPRFVSLHGMDDLDRAIDAEIEAASTNS